MTRLYLVRHGRASAGWATEPDPGLDELGRMQSEQVAERLAPLGPLPVITSPFLRCQETSRPLCRTWGTTARLDDSVAEVPSPPGSPADRIAWLAVAARSTWSQLGEPYSTFRDRVAETLLTFDADAVVFSHFIAINAAIGAATGDDRVVVRSLDNCSVTIIDAVDGSLQLVEGGHEAETLIR